MAKNSLRSTLLERKIYRLLLTSIYPLFSMANHQKYVDKLKGSRTLIVGGTSGVGFCIAEAVLEHGASKVMISSSQVERVGSAVQKVRRQPCF